MSNISSRVYIVLFAILFVTSTIILLIASIAKEPVPLWGGYLDVGIVFLITLSGFIIHQRNKNAPRYDISYQIAVYLVPLTLVRIWIYRNSLDFNILLPGLAWRVYFLLSILPHTLRLWKPE